MRTYIELIDALADMVARDHCYACAEDHCDVTASSDDGYSLWAIECHASGGAAGDEFDALMSELRSRFGARFTRESEAERDEFAAQALTLHCDACNCYMYITDHNRHYYAGNGAECSNCLASVRLVLDESEA